jgi:hypothetical protein
MLQPARRSRFLLFMETLFFAFKNHLTDSDLPEPAEIHHQSENQPGKPGQYPQSCPIGLPGIIAARFTLKREQRPDLSLYFPQFGTQDAQDIPND